MIQAGFFSVFNFIANNRWAQVVLTIGVALVVYKWQAEHHEARGRRQERARGHKRARKIQEKNKDRLDEKSAQVTRARNSVPPVSGSASVPDDLRSVLFGDDGNDS